MHRSDSESRSGCVWTLELFKQQFEHNHFTAIGGRCWWTHSGCEQQNITAHRRLRALFHVSPLWNEDGNNVTNAIQYISYIMKCFLFGSTAKTFKSPETMLYRGGGAAASFPLLSWRMEVSSGQGLPLRPYLHLNTAARRGRDRNAS